jgi:hypothetical protein
MRGTLCINGRSSAKAFHFLFCFGEGNEGVGHTNGPVGVMGTGIVASIEVKTKFHIDCVIPGWRAALRWSGGHTMPGQRGVTIATDTALWSNI